MVKNTHGIRLGGKHLKDLKRSDFSEARDRLRLLQKHPQTPPEACKEGKCACPKLTPATVNRRMGFISAVLTAAVEWEWVGTNPSKLKKLPEDNARTRILSGDEQTRLLAAAQLSDEPSMYAFIVCALMSGRAPGSPG